jgi:hypothetical protein
MGTSEVCKNCGRERDQHSKDGLCARSLSSYWEPELSSDESGPEVKAIGPETVVAVLKGKMGNNQLYIRDERLNDGQLTILEEIEVECRVLLPEIQALIEKGEKYDTEIKKLNELYEMAVKGRAEMREGIKARDSQIHELQADNAKLVAELIAMKARLGQVIQLTNNPGNLDIEEQLAEIEIQLKDIKGD